MASPGRVLADSRYCLYLELLVRIQARGQGSGVPTEIVQSHLLRLRGGRLSELHWFTSREEGLEAAGLA